MTSSLSWRLAFCFTLWLSQPLSLQAQETLADWRDVPVAQLEQGAQNGVADAQYALGLRLEKGRGLLQNFALAATWFTRAADQGHAAAQHRLGQYYFDGIGWRQTHRPL
ncbi:sel1 repeat family protein (plasmid) [Parasedimentitalea marina]|uniref:Sel1 repeat family protein n=1 Tax=Parasedimentitalea marina TaxID=2483033 RepID=A0A3T0N9G3_9RHOB|nr:tetratricopeptide repeat protein [Parasedimentitalea marina]AZV80668.1 sel1 repeat family protein [Parasedimentitalea marina]